VKRRGKESRRRNHEWGTREREKEQQASEAVDAINKKTFGLQGLATGQKKAWCGRKNPPNRKTAKMKSKRKKKKKKRQDQERHVPGAPRKIFPGLKKSEESVRRDTSPGKELNINRKRKKRTDRQDCLKGKVESEGETALQLKFQRLRKPRRRQRAEKPCRKREKKKEEWKERRERQGEPKYEWPCYGRERKTVRKLLMSVFKGVPVEKGNRKKGEKKN